MWWAEMYKSWHGSVIQFSFNSVCLLPISLHQHHFWMNPNLIEGHTCLVSSSLISNMASTPFREVMPQICHDCWPGLVCCARSFSRTTSWFFQVLLFHFVVIISLPLMANNQLLTTYSHSIFLAQLFMNDLSICTSSCVYLSFLPLHGYWKCRKWDAEFG